MESRKIFSDYEKAVFKELITKHPHITSNNTNRGLVTLDQRNAAWYKVMEDYNSINGVTNVSFSLKYHNI